MGMWVQAAGLALSVIGQVQQGQAAKQASEGQATVLQQQARHEERQAEIDAGEFRRDQLKVLGSSRAARGASGVQLTTGSPLLTDDEMIAEIAFQTTKIRRGGEISAARKRQQADLERSAGRSAGIGGFLGGGSTLLTGGAQAFGGGGFLPSSSASASATPLRRTTQPRNAGGIGAA